MSKSTSPTPALQAGPPNGRGRRRAAPAVSRQERVELAVREIRDHLERDYYEDDVFTVAVQAQGGLEPIGRDMGGGLDLEGLLAVLRHLLTNIGGRFYFEYTGPNYSRAILTIKYAGDLCIMVTA